MLISRVSDLRLDAKHNGHYSTALEQSPNPRASESHDVAHFVLRGLGDAGHRFKANIQDAIHWIDEAGKEGCKLIAFPELC